MGLDGIEPSTSELSALRSNRLSYSPVRDEQDYRTSEARPNRGCTPLDYQPYARCHRSWRRAYEETAGHSFSERVTSTPPTRSAQTL